MGRVLSTREKQRAHIPGDTLKAKFAYVYDQNPLYTPQEFKEILALSNLGQVYSLKNALLTERGITKEERKELKKQEALRSQAKATGDILTTTKSKEDQIAEQLTKQLADKEASKSPTDAPPGDKSFEEKLAEVTGALSEHNSERQVQKQQVAPPPKKSVRMLKEIKDQIPGNTIKAKFAFLYNENPNYTAKEYAVMLGTTLPTVYTMLHQTRKALGISVYKKSNQAQQEVAATTHQQSEALQVSQSSEVGKEHAEHAVDLIHDPLSSEQEPQAPVEQTASLSNWEDPFTQMELGLPFEDSILPFMQEPVQDLVKPTPPTFEVNLQGIDGATIQAFAALVSAKAEKDKTYRFSIVLIEEN